MAEGFCEMMMARGLEHFLMRDYVPSVDLYGSDLDNKNIAHEKISRLLLEMLTFLELPDVVGLVIENASSDDTGKSQAGSYNRQGYNRMILINLRTYYAPYNVIAILCHEVTHYFMEYNRLNWNDTEMNEQRTDTVANLIGFSRIMQRGYREIRHSIYSGFTSTNKTHKIGYITVKDCCDLEKFLSYCRDNIREKQEASRQISEIRRKTAEYIDTAKTLYLQLSYLDLQNLEPDSPERLKEIQIVLMQKEARNISGDIENISLALRNASDMSQLLNINQKASKLCEDMSLWLAALRGR